MVKIKDYTFEKNTPDVLRKDATNRNWPVVYLLNNQDELYVGETISAMQRMKQHLENPDRQRLDHLHIIYDEDFNKSATLDVESSLIALMGADKKYQLQNGCSGVVYHKYNNMHEFSQDSARFNEIWRQLQQRHMVTQELEKVRNSDLFKYSPYKSLTEDQCMARDSIIATILECMIENEHQHFVVDGAAGTGKTVLALYLLFLFVNGKYNDDEDESIEYEFARDLKKIQNLKGGNLKVAYVVAMTPLRKTLKKVVKSIKGLKSDMIIGPTEVLNEHFDILIVDEAHRLKRAVGLGADVGSFYTANEKLNLGKTKGTQLDWIMNQSDFQILFYDSQQQIRPSDIRSEDFDRLIFHDENGKFTNYTLESQMRCLGGNDYVRFIKDIFAVRAENKISNFDNYEFVMFKHIHDFTDALLIAESEYKLCRMVAGYSWKWASKKNPEKIDIRIEDMGFKWNLANKEFIISTEGNRIIKEVGCVHTIQGFDLNYCGVIIGNEITYNEEKNRIEIVKENYYDRNGKACVLSDKELHDYIINIYCVLMTRGIRGTFVYCCDEKLRKYLSQYIETK